MIAGANAIMIVSEIYRQGPDTIRKIVSGIEQYLNFRHYDSLRAFQNAKPEVELSSEHALRSESIDPLTVSKKYNDPTPVASYSGGDSFGHRTN